MSKELKVSDIARRHGVTRRTAYRWLVEIERKFGPSVVGRRGKRGDLVTTEEAFAKVAPLGASKNGDERRVQDLEERMSDAECRSDRHAEQISELRRQMSALSAKCFPR